MLSVTVDDVVLPVLYVLIPLISFLDVIPLSSGTNFSAHNEMLLFSFPSKSNTTSHVVIKESQRTISTTNLRTWHFTLTLGFTVIFHDCLILYYQFISTSLFSIPFWFICAQTIIGEYSESWLRQIILLKYKQRGVLTFGYQSIDCGIVPVFCLTRWIIFVWVHSLYPLLPLNYI